MTRYQKIGAAGLVVLLLTLPGLLFLPGCTDLGEETFGVVTPEEFYRTEDEILAALAPIYAQLRLVPGGDYLHLSEVSTDEAVIPTRGSDWFDGGIHLAVHRFTWDATLPQLNNAWNDAFTGIARANGLLQTIEGSDIPNVERITAEIRALRAYYYYLLMDLFGGVPVVGDEEGEFTVDPQNPPAQEPRPEVFAFIVDELLAVRDALPEKGEVAYGRVTQAFADALLANLYINAAVFTSDGIEGIQPNDYNSCDGVTVAALEGASLDACQAAINAVNRILDTGLYDLADMFFDNFEPNNQDSPENIFVAAHAAVDGLGFNFPHRTLHYNQFTPSPWNGWATLAETYGAFDEQDVRRDMFLAGRAFHVLTGEPVQNRQGEPLFFTPIIGDITNATEGEGVRIMKFPADPAHEGPNNGNDYPIFRLAEMYLIKAEALNELGQTQQAIQILNMLRARAFDPDEPIPSTLTQAQLRDVILRERLFELFLEAKRRQDLIRFGEFLEAWSFKNPAAAFRLLYPIPQTQLDSNPNLVQNTGY